MYAQTHSHAGRTHPQRHRRGHVTNALPVHLLRQVYVGSFFVLFRSLGALGSHLGALGSHLVAKLARNGAKMGGNSPT